MPVTDGNDRTRTGKRVEHNATTYTFKADGSLFLFRSSCQSSSLSFYGAGFRTRNIWLQNEQAVLSPQWSIHAAAGTFQLYIYLGNGR